MTHDEPINTRRAPHMEQYTRVSSCATEQFPDAHRLELLIGNQGFLFGYGDSDTHDTKDGAEWWRDMLCIALNELRSQVIAECIKAIEAEFASERGGYDPEAAYTSGDMSEAYYTAGHRATAAVLKLRVKT